MTRTPHPIDKALDEGQRVFEHSGDVAAAMRYAVVQAWADGWTQGVKHGEAEKQRRSKLTPEITAEIEASRKRFADLAATVIDAKGA